MTGSEEMHNLWANDIQKQSLVFSAKPKLKFCHKMSAVFVGKTDPKNKSCIQKRSEIKVWLIFGVYIKRKYLQKL